MANKKRAPIMCGALVTHLVGALELFDPLLIPLAPFKQIEWLTMQTFASMKLVDSTTEGYKWKLRYQHILEAKAKMVKINLSSE